MRAPAGRRVFALRSLVVMPGALVEGVLAVVLPWLVARASQGTAWLGALAALLVVAGLTGTLLAPLASTRFGSRRVVVGAATVAAAALALAAALWWRGSLAWAGGVVLIALAADGMADVAFGARAPLMARLAKKPLMQFAATNWLWSVSGVAVGCMLAGASLGNDGPGHLPVAWLAAGTAALASCVAAGLAVWMPRDPRRPLRVRGLPGSDAARVPWTRRTVALIAVVAGTSFLYGPVDNLLAPAHLASQGLDASTFGALMAASALGLALGLSLARHAHADRHGRPLMVAGFAAIVAQLAVLWYLPGMPVLVAVSFVTSAAVAPLLPLLENAALKAVVSHQRTALLAAVGTAASVADLAGTAAFGTLAGAAGTQIALGVATFMGAGALAFAGPIARRVMPLPIRDRCGRSPS